MIYRFLAYFRLSQKVICEQSKGKGLYNDYHDYPDGVIGYPWHFYVMTCKRCNKNFMI